MIAALKASAVQLNGMPSGPTLGVAGKCALHVALGPTSALTPVSSSF